MSSKRQVMFALALALAALMSFAAAGCGDDEETTTTTPTTTTEPIGATGPTGAQGAQEAGALGDIQANLEAAGYSASPGKASDLTPEFASIEAEEGLTVSGKDVTFAFVLAYPSEEDAQTVAGEADDAGQANAIDGSVLFVGPADQDAINGLALDAAG